LIKAKGSLTVNRIISEIENWIYTSCIGVIVFVFDVAKIYFFDLKIKFY